MVDFDKIKGNAVNPGNLNSEGCTIFTVSFGEKVFYGNNEDWYNWESYIWFDTDDANNGTGYGTICVGYDDPNHLFIPYGAMNEKGLCFDMNALPPVPLNRPVSNADVIEVFKSGIMSLMRECSTVEEVIEMFPGIFTVNSIMVQFHFADSDGDAVVISGGPDGELVYTRKEKGDGYLLSTNFNKANPKNAGPGLYPCWRYKTADSMLKEIEYEKDLTVDKLSSILDACHQEGAMINTDYTNLFDLRTRTVYLYYFHRFDEVVTLDLTEELTKGSRYIKMRDLFSEKTVNDAVKEYRSYLEIPTLKSEMRGVTEKPTAVIIEMGKKVTRVGFGGESEPRLNVNTALYYGENDEPSIRRLNNPEDSKPKKAVWFKEKEKPFDRNRVELFMKHIYKMLDVSSDKLPVFIVTWMDSPPAKVPVRDMIETIGMTDVLFTKFNVPAIYFGLGNLTSLYGGDRFTGLNVNISDAEIQIGPVNRGLLQADATRIIDSTRNDISVVINESINSCEPNLRSALWENIVLSGDSEMLLGLNERLLQDLPELADKGVKVNVIDLPERQYLSWIGGSCLTMWKRFKRYWITIDEFNDKGLSCLERMQIRT